MSNTMNPQQGGVGFMGRDSIRQYMDYRIVAANTLRVITAHLGIKFLCAI